MFSSKTVVKNTEAEWGIFRSHYCITIMKEAKGLWLIWLFSEGGGTQQGEREMARESREEGEIGE